MRPSCFKMPANTGPQKLDILATFYFLSNLQLEFLETKTVMANHHRLFSELSAGIPICCWKVQNKPKIETKKGIKSSLSLIQYALVIAHPKTQSSQASYTHLSAFLEDHVQRSGPEIVMAFSTVKDVCSSFHSFLSSLHQNEASWYVARTLKHGRIKAAFLISVSLLCVNIYNEKLLKILNQKKNRKDGFKITSKN